MDEIIKNCLKYKNNIKFDLNLFVDDKEEKLSINFQPNPFDKDFNSKNFEIIDNRINNKLPMGKIIISLLNNLKEVQKISKDTIDTYKKLNSLKLEDYQRSLFTFYKRILDINPYFILFINRFKTSYFIDVENDIYETDNEELLEEISQAQNKDSYYFEYYVSEFNNFINEILLHLTSTLRFVDFNSNNYILEKCIKNFDISESDLDKINKLDDFTIINSQTHFRKRNDNVAHTKFFTNYSIVYENVIEYFTGFLISYLPMYYSNVFKLHICKDKNCCNFFLANRHREYCCEECSKKNKYNRVGDLDFNNQEIKEFYKRVSQMFRDKSKAMKKKNKYSNGELLLKKRESFAKKYTKMHKQYNSTPSINNYKVVMDFMEIISNNLKNANKKSDIDNIFKGTIFSRKK